LKRVNWGRVSTVLRGDEHANEASLCVLVQVNTAAFGKHRPRLLEAETPWTQLDDNGRDLYILEDRGEPLMS
jgi:hypothetical protein